MAQDDYDYPEDEFDVLGSNRTPQAVHRAPRPWWRVWGPLVAVVIIAPLIAFGLVELATRDSSAAPDPTATSSEVATDPGTGETPPEGETTEPPAPEETTPVEEETTPEPPPLDRSVAVRVLNGASVQGLAGRVAETVEGDGWTAVEPGNYTSRLPEASTVYYNNPELLPQAQALAELLGIEPVAELADVESITVVLRPDFSE